jgi:hypothetical protein
MRPPKNMPIEEPDPFAEAASRLCSACGMCCDGVLFYGVVLQPADAAKELSALGLFLKRKRNQTMFLQPCSAHKECQCSIYHARPTRCRAFECRQLMRLRDGEIEEGTALDRIRKARSQVEPMLGLLRKAGDKNEKRDLFSRCASLLEKSPEVFPEIASFQEEIRERVVTLNTFLSAEFRTE